MVDPAASCEVGFYHLTRSSLEEALPRLLEKVLASGKNTVVLGCTDQRIEQLSRHFWTYRTDSFLPHGSKIDGFADKQPIYLSSEIDDRPNNPNVQICIDNTSYGDLSSLEKCLDFFDGNDPQNVAEARRRWTSANEAGLKVVYWQQNERGGWTRAG